jgi:hypothetical protein
MDTVSDGEPLSCGYVSVCADSCGLIALIPLTMIIAQKVQEDDRDPAINRCMQVPDRTARRGHAVFAGWCPSAAACCSLRSKLRSGEANRTCARMIKMDVL